MIGLLCLPLIIAFFATATTPVNHISVNESYPVNPEFQVLEDNANQFIFETIAQAPVERWRDMSSERASFGFTESSFWLRTSISNHNERVSNFVLELDYPLLDSVSFMGIHSTGTSFSFSTGDTLPFYPRHIDHPSNLLRFQLAPQERIEVYIRVQTEGSMILPLKLWEERAFFEIASVEQKIHFYYYGAVSVIILINLAVFFTLRERLYLYYAVAIAGYLVFFATSRGYLHQLILPNAPDLNSRLFLISMPLLALFSVMFARQFLKTKELCPKLDIALRMMIVFECFNLILAIFGDYDMVVRVSAIGAVLLFSVLFVAGPVVLFIRPRSGLFFTVAWTPLTIGFFATSGRTAGFLPNNFLTEYAMQMGSGIEAVVLTLALADRLYREREQKIHAQAESLNVEKQRNMTQALLTESMSRDPITKLSNRNRFEWLVKDRINRDPEKRYILTVAKLTRIDDITRTLGLSRVESILKSVAEQLSTEFERLEGMVLYCNENGEKESVFQLSRETFGAFIEQKAFEQNTEQYYNALRRASEPVEVQNICIDLSPIFGSALYPKHGDTPAQLIRNALIALEASRHSKDMMGIFHERLDIYDEGRLMLVVELREALEKDELQIYYQPKLDLRSGEIIGFEALARWIHPIRGFVPPDEFISLAEDAGFITRLTLWAFEKAIIDFEVLCQQGYCGSVSVNISARDLLVRNLSRSLKSILEKYSTPAEKIYLELTETGAMEDPETGIATLNELSKLGLRISIDDFGTGYSSLSYLQRLPASEIKLDRSLVSDICSSESTAIIAKTSKEMVHALGYQIVAEGVENEQTMEQLREDGFDYIQGYWLCKPIPLNEMKEWLASRS
ncbi:MAG: EAL domain-containing protein [Aestuariibacter sp.]